MADAPSEDPLVPPTAAFEQAPISTEGSESPASPHPVATRRPWGPWATIGWTTLGIAVMIAIQNVVAIGFVLVRLSSHPREKLEDLATKIVADGNLLALATLASTPAVLGLVALLVSVRRYPLRDYLALRWAPPRQILLALAGLVIMLAASDLTSYLLGRPIVPPFMEGVYRTGWLPLLLLALLVATPLGEEVLMRGFLFRGIVTSRWGPFPAILISSIAWAMMHIQYDLYGIGQIIVLGVFMGWVRHRTGSLLLTMLLHGIANAVATAEVIVQAHWMN